MTRVSIIIIKKYTEIRTLFPLITPSIDTTTATTAHTKKVRKGANVLLSRLWGYTRCLRDTFQWPEHGHKRRHNNILPADMHLSVRAHLDGRFNSHRLHTSYWMRKIHTPIHYRPIKWWLTATNGKDGKRLYIPNSFFSPFFIHNQFSNAWKITLKRWRRCCWLHSSPFRGAVEFWWDSARHCRAARRPLPRHLSERKNKRWWVNTVE